MKKKFLSTDEVKHELQNQGLKATSQRITILKLLSECESHPSADMIMQRLIDDGVHMSFATVYNVLDTLVAHGLVVKLKDENEVMRFDYNTEFHVHIYQESTGKISDFFDGPFCERTEKYLQELFGDRDICKIDLHIHVKK